MLDLGFFFQYFKSMLLLKFSEQIDNLHFDYYR